MKTIITILLVIIFLFLSGLHFYWGFGGKWGNEAVIPTKDDNIKVMMPGPVPTFVVAFGLCGFAALVLFCSVDLYITLPKWLEIIHNYGLWALASVFILRAIGDFRYVGIFKKYKHTKFGINDTKYYAPLCIFIGVLLIWLELIR